MLRKRIVHAGLCALLVAAVVAGVVAWRVDTSSAADHLDPPSRTGLTAAPRDGENDIGDYYAWHQGSGASATVVAALTFNGPMPAMAGQGIACDADALYTFHFDTDDDSVSDIDVHARFGEDDVGNCFVTIQNIPGAGGAVVTAPVERVVNRSGVTVFAGLRDDPFFFDLQGFQDTLSTETLSFVNDRDFFAMQNMSAIVIEFPLSAVSSTGGPFRTWATTSRFGG